MDMPEGQGPHPQPLRFREGLGGPRVSTLGSRASSQEELGGSPAEGTNR